MSQNISRILRYTSSQLCIGTTGKKCPVHYTSSSSDDVQRPIIYFSGIQPTGVPHLGNYFGFIEHWVGIQNNHSATHKMYLSIVDYHAISTGFSRTVEIRSNILRMGAALLACGVDPARSILFQQSTIPAHTELMYILGSLVTVAKLQRMPQYKDKAACYNSDSIPLCLQIYPVLQAADILLYGATHVPVGDDQTQHLELTRDFAKKFNQLTKSSFFQVPVQILSRAIRVRSLSNPMKKMSKSDSDQRSRISIDDSREVISERCQRALSDMNPWISYDPENRPAISSLIDLYCLFAKLEPKEVEEKFVAADTRGFKHALAEVIDMRLSPIREKYECLVGDEEYLREILAHGRFEAHKVASKNIELIKDVVGLKL